MHTRDQFYVHDVVPKVWHFRNNTSYQQYLGETTDPDLWILQSLILDQSSK